MASETDHILMLPFMAQGHFGPFLELAHRLHSKSQFTITILTTPLNAHTLRQNLPSTAIKVAALPFNSADHGLPPDVEDTSKLPLPLVISIWNSTTSLQPHLLNFISQHFPPTQPPLCIIFDAYLGWVDTVARSVGSTGIAFTTAGAYGTAAYMSIWTHLPHRNYSDDEEFTVPGFPENHRFRRSQLHRFFRYADGSDNWSKFFQPQLKLSMESSGFVCNSVEEIEPLGFDIIRKVVKLPVWGVGPLIPNNNNNKLLSSDVCIDWLDLQKKDSVLYISFGSQNTFSPTQMMELAAGLELSGKPFLWVIRPPFGFDINGELKPEWLPEGFEERMKEKKQGMVVHKWGPQLKILGHESTGVFLSHCGWNSVLEALREGVPMLGWPLAAEQPYNSKMLEEEMGVAVEVARGLEGEVNRERVRRIVEMVMDREEGSKGWDMKKKAVEMGKKMKEATMEEGEVRGSSVKALDDFLDALLSTRRHNQTL